MRGASPRKCFTTTLVSSAMGLPAMLIEAFAFLQGGGKGVAHGAAERSGGIGNGLATALASGLPQLLDVARGLFQVLAGQVFEIVDDVPKRGHGMTVADGAVSSSAAARLLAGWQRSWTAWSWW